MNTYQVRQHLAEWRKQEATTGVKVLPLDDLEWAIEALEIVTSALQDLGSAADRAVARLNEAFAEPVVSSPFKYPAGEERRGEQGCGQEG